MAFRDTIDGLTREFIDRVLAVLTTATVADLARSEHRSRARRPSRERTRKAEPERPGPDRSAPPPPPEPLTPEPDPPAPRSPPPPSPSDGLRFERSLLFEPPLPLDSPLCVPADKWRVRLDDLELSVRIHGVLLSAGYQVLGDLDGHALVELTLCRNFGRTSLRELRSTLASFGVRERRLFTRDTQVRVPPDKLGVPVDDVVTSSSLATILFGAGYAVLGDLDGRTMGDLARCRHLGRVRLGELAKALRRLGVIEPLPPTDADGCLPNEQEDRTARIEVPAFALDYRFDELPLSADSRRALTWDGGLALLGDVNGRSASELPHVSPHAIDELRSVLKAIAQAGPPDPACLLDMLDAALDRLTEPRRQVLLLRFGGTGEDQLSLAETGRRCSRSRSWMSYVQKRALSDLRRVAGPEFGRALRELERKSSASGVDLGEELARVGRSASTSRHSRPWDFLPFYERLVGELAPSLARPGPRETRRSGVGSPPAEPSTVEPRGYVFRR
jgi:hypothetical protein